MSRGHEEWVGKKQTAERRARLGPHGIAWLTLRGSRHEAVTRAGAGAVLRHTVGHATAATRRKKDSEFVGW
jgi:hypothetical protein